MSRQFSIYTPSLHEIDDLEARLVGPKRRHAERTVATVRKSVLDGGCHHLLFVGPRGIGKTHLVSVCFHRLRNDEELRQRVALAWIREEHYGIASAADLFRRIIEAVRTDNAGAEIPEGPSAEAELRTLTRHRHVVVFAENLNDLFRRIGPHGQQVLRALIQETAAVSLVATTPALFPGVSDAESPFYGTFDTTHIDEMSLDEATELLLRVAELRGDDSLIAALRRPETRRRLQVIQALAGGHPRIWMLFADSLTVGDIDELVPLFLKMLDDLTPYYQDRMRDLEGDQERIVALLCDQLGALSVGEIADRCEIEHRVASTAVGRLETKGFVRRASHAGKDRRRAYYELREPLLRLCLQVKEARGKPVQLIVDFLRGWYDQADVWSLLAQVPAGSLAVDYLRIAFFDEPPSPNTLTGVPPGEREVRVDGLFKVFPEASWIRASKAASAYLQGDAEMALALLEGSTEQPMDDVLRLAASVRAGTAKGPQILRQLHSYVEGSVSARDLFLLASALEDLNDLEGALIAQTKASQLVPGEAFIHELRGQTLYQLGRFEEAVQAFDDARAFDEPTHRSRRLRSSALLELKRFDELLTESQTAAVVAPDLLWPHLALCTALLVKGRRAEALVALDDALSLDPLADVAQVLRELARELPAVEDSAPGGPDSIGVFTESVERKPNSGLLRALLAEALAASGQISEARDQIEHATALQPGDPQLWSVLAQMELRLDNWEGFMAAVSRVFELSSGGHIGDPAEFCSLLTSNARRVPALVDLYESHDALAGLGRGLVASIPSVVGPRLDMAQADELLRAWNTAGAGHDELVIPLRILAAAVAWKADGDDAHLLRLPAEERAVLEPMLRGPA